MTNYGSKHKREQLKQNEEYHCIDISEMTSHDVAMDFHCGGCRLQMHEYHELCSFIDSFKRSNLNLNYVTITYKNVTFTLMQNLDHRATVEDWDEERSPYLAEKENQL